MVVNSIWTYIPVLTTIKDVLIRNGIAKTVEIRDIKNTSYWFLAVKAWFSYVGKIPDDRGLYDRQGKAPIVWDFPEIWKLSLTNKKVRGSWRYKMT